MESNVEKLRRGNPLVDVMTDDIWEVLSSDKFNGMTVAETVGVIEFIKNDLIMGNWG